MYRRICYIYKLSDTYTKLSNSDTNKIFTTDKTPHAHASIFS